MKNRIAATLLAFCMVLALLPGTALAVNKSGTCGKNVTWTLNNDVLTISGSGPMSDLTPYLSVGGIGLDVDVPWETKRIETVIISSGVTTVGDWMFFNCYSLQNVTIPSSVTQIGKWAFYGTGLTNVTIPSGAAIIGDDAFSFCDRLRNIDIPASVTSIGNAAFMGCNSLERVTIPSGVTKIGWMTFSGCKSLKSVAIPSSVTSIGDEAFSGCSKLDSIVIPAGVTSIGDSAFSGCGVLRSIQIPSSVTKIGNNVFKDTYVRDIYYSGTQEQWKKISIGSENKDLSYIKMHYSDSAPSATYTVTFNANGGTTPITSKTVTTGSTYGDLPIPTWSGYTFFGWWTSSTGGTEITSTTTVTQSSPHTLYANWRKLIIIPFPVQVKLIFNNGSMFDSLTMPVGNTYGNLFTPTRPGYTFDGWYTSSTGGTKITPTTMVTQSSPRTLYAHWTKNSTVKTMTVTFNANGGTTPTKSKTVTNGGTYGTLPAPARTGYKFDGWFTSKTGGTKVTSATKVTKTANHTLYARWLKRTFSVALDPNGGALLTDSVTATLGARYRSLPTPSRANYYFDGWYTAKTGGTKITAATQVKTGVKTLYAHWTKTAPKVTSRPSGVCQIIIPEDYRVLLYINETTATVAKNAAAQTDDYTVTCTKMVKLSNGTVRYCGIFPKVSKTVLYWFTFSDEMFVN